MYDPRPFLRICISIIVSLLKIYKPIVTEEALEAFTLHMDRLVATHGEIVVVNLLDSEGKEAPLGDEFAKVVSSERARRLL